MTHAVKMILMGVVLCFCTLGLVGFMEPKPTIEQCYLVICFGLMGLVLTTIGVVLHRIDGE